MTAVDSSPGRAHASPDCQGASPGPHCGLLGAGQSPVWACSWGPLLRPCLLHSTEAAGVRCRRAENHGLALSQSFPSTLATLSVLYHSWTASMILAFGQTIRAPHFAASPSLGDGLGLHATKFNHLHTYLKAKQSYI